MASLLTQAEKDVLDVVISTTMFDTFKSTIKVWKRPQVTVISTNPDYSFILGDGEAEEITHVPQYEEFEAVIKYLRNENDESLLAGSALTQERFNNSKVKVRIKVKQAAYEYLKDSEKVELDGRLYEIASGSRQHGVFSRSIHSIYLKEVE